MYNLSNKIALITGAGAGIGHAICKELSSMGATIIAVARNENNLQQLKTELPQCNHQFWSIDLSDENGHNQLLKNLEQFSFPHIVVINLHIPSDKKKLINITKDSFSDNFTANLDHLFTIMPKVLQFQRSEKFGRWIGISSFAAHIGIPGQAIYNAQKSAMEAVLTSLAAEEGKYGITSNVVAPGIIATPSVQERIPKDIFNLAAQCNVMKRAGTAEEVAAAAGFFASPEASYITGITLPVCGGAQLAWNFS